MVLPHLFLLFSCLASPTWGLATSHNNNNPNLLAAMRGALGARRELLEEMAERRTTCYRVLHGATEGIPGLTVDRYGDTLLFQTFRGAFSSDDAQLIADCTSEVEVALSSPLRPVLSHRGEVAEGVSKATRRTAYRALQREVDSLRGSAGASGMGGGDDDDDPDDDDPDGDRSDDRSKSGARWGERGYQASVVGLENGLAFDCTPRPGQDPGLYLDFRAGREWLRANAKGKHVLNCFCYTATAGVAAAAGGARSVTNVDFSPSALGVGRINVGLNSGKRGGGGDGGGGGDSVHRMGRCGMDTLRAALDGRQETLTSALKAWKEGDGDFEQGGAFDAGEEEEAVVASAASTAYSGFKLLRADMLPTLRQLGGLPPGGRRTKAQAYGGRGGRGGGRGGRGGGRGGRGGGGRGGGGRGGGGGGGGALQFKAQTFDIVVLDPPTFSSSPFGAVDIVRDYQTLLKPAVLAAAAGGGAVLATNHVSGVDLDDWLAACERCCAKAGRPLTQPPEVLTPHRDFPPMADQKHPLKMAILRV